MPYATGHLQEHPLPSGIVGALTLTGYQLLVDIAGVGAGRLGPQVFLLVAPEPERRSGRRDDAHLPAPDAARR